ncbi:uncharacterized protein LOC143451654 isoform X2 [Clavelina lepadiformis]|uniref:uncharacterized protein LOC143451654 isoform X2 n=1 Tax=Clavelina lepadiformis TaxID=159417 RepID=UPI00404175FF
MPTVERDQNVAKKQLNWQLTYQAKEILQDSSQSPRTSASTKQHVQEIEDDNVEKIQPTSENIQVGDGIAMAAEIWDSEIGEKGVERINEHEKS